MCDYRLPLLWVLVLYYLCFLRKCRHRLCGWDMAYGSSPRGGLGFLLLLGLEFVMPVFSVASDLPWMVWVVPCAAGVCERLVRVGVLVWLPLLLGLTLVGILVMPTCGLCRVSDVSISVVVLWVWVIVAWDGGVRLSSWTCFFPVMVSRISFSMWNWMVCIFLTSCSS